MLALEALFTDKPIHAFELVQLCRHTEHRPFGRTGHDLATAGLIEHAAGRFTVHDSIRNVVLSAVEGDGLSMTLRNPVA